MIAQTYIPKTKQVHSLHKKRNVETGFPSPATDHLEERLNLHDHLVKYPSSTFFVKVNGSEDTSLGLNNGDILIVDRSLAPKMNSLVIAEIEGEHVVCRVKRIKNEWVLEKGDGLQLSLTGDTPGQSPVWGKVTHLIHAV